jgi:hypothetical protein
MSVDRAAPQARLLAAVEAPGEKALTCAPASSGCLRRGVRRHPLPGGGRGERGGCFELTPRISAAIDARQSVQLWNVQVRPEGRPEGGTEVLPTRCDANDTIIPGDGFSQNPADSLFAGKPVIFLLPSDRDLKLIVRDRIQDVGALVRIAYQNNSVRIDPTRVDLFHPARGGARRPSAPRRAAWSSAHASGSSRSAANPAASRNTSRRWASTAWIPPGGAITAAPRRGPTRGWRGWWWPRSSRCTRGRGARSWTAWAGVRRACRGRRSRRRRW